MHADDRSVVHGQQARQHERVGGFFVELGGVVVELLLEHPLLEGVEEDLLGARVLLRLGAVDERPVPRRAEVELVQHVLVEGALAALDHRRRVDPALEHLVDHLQAVEPEVRLDACKNIYSKRSS